MSKTLDRALASAKKAEARAARILAHETLVSRLRDATALARARDYSATADALASTSDLLKALIAGEQPAEE